MDRAAARIAGAWPAAVLLLADPAGWYPFGPSKWLATGVGAALLGVCVFASRTRAVAVAPARALGALVVVMGVASITALDPRLAWTGTPERHFGLVTWGILAVAFAAGTGVVSLRAVADGLVVAGAGVGAFATAEVLGWEPRLFAVDDRTTATLGSPAYLGAAAALVLPVAVACALDPSRTTVRRALASLTAASLVVAVVGSGARGAWLGLAIAGLATIGARARALAATTLRRRPRRVLVTVLGVGVALVLAATVGGAADRLATLGDPDAPGGTTRLDEWRVAARVAQAHPLLGTGPEGYRLAFGGAVDADYQRAHGRAVIPDRAHDAPLDVLVTGGVFALVAWLAAIALVGRHVLRALLDERVLVRGAGAALVAHLAGSLVLFPLAELEPFAWLLAGSVVAATARPAELRVVRRGRSHVVVATIGALVALAFVVLGTLDVAADRAARDAVDALTAGDTERARRRADDAVTYRPDEVRLRLLRAEAALAAGRGTDEALDALDAARTISPLDPVVRRTRVDVLVARAAATGRADHLAVARAAADDALARDPLEPALLLARAQLAALDGDDAAARAWRSQAEDLGG